MDAARTVPLPARHNKPKPCRDLIQSHPRPLRVAPAGSRRHYPESSLSFLRACFGEKVTYSLAMIVNAVSNHVRLDEHGVAWIDNTRSKVIEVALDHIAYGWGAEEIHRQHPHLSLAQTHAALAFYYDHQAEFDQAIATSLARAEKLAAEGADSPGRSRLRAMGLIP